MIRKISVFLLAFSSCQSDSYSVEESTNSSDVSAVFEYVLLSGSKHPCTRTCTKDGVPMICRYTFTVEWYQTLSKACYNCPYNKEDCFRPHCIPGDGSKRPVLVVNRRMPGPSVEVCLGDEVVVDVENRLLGETTSIHWHGHHQRDTPYMDGVPFVTQCPISPASTFRYQFTAVHAGTHFWHSHTGLQRTDGSFGAFVVKVPEEDDPHSDLYDYDLSSHVVVIMDWNKEVGLSKFILHHHGDGDNKPETLLVNGLGRFIQDHDNNQTVYTPTARFVVERGYRYRFRIINAEFLNCPIEISVDNHTLTIISSDGKDFAPVKAESIVIYAGERYDFIINADQSRGLYWMRFRGLMDCDQRFKSAYQVAVLQYQGESDTEYPDGDPDYASSHKEGLQVSPLNKGSGENGSVNVVELQSLDKWDVSLKQTPDFKFYISYDFYKLDNPHFHVPGLYGYNYVTNEKQRLSTPQLNHISLKLLPFPLLSGRDQLEPDQFCNKSTVKNCSHEYCECTHVLQVPLNSVVEFVMIDEGFMFDANHPFHLHGYSFRVVAMKKIGENVTEEEVRRLDEEGLIHRNLVNPPLKDTVNVPDGGYTILRLHATNPGYWLFHCHIEFHVEIGMALVFKVGEDSEMLPVPKNFPQCGNYMPDYHSVVNQRNNETGKNLTDIANSITVPSGYVNSSQNSNKFYNLILWPLIVIASFIFK